MTLISWGSLGRRPCSRELARWDAALRARMRATAERTDVGRRYRACLGRPTLLLTLSRGGLTLGTRRGLLDLAAEGCARASVPHGAHPTSTRRRDLAAGQSQRPKAEEDSWARLDRCDQSRARGRARAKDREIRCGLTATRASLAGLRPKYETTSDAAGDAAWQEGTSAARHAVTGSRRSVARRGLGRCRRRHGGPRRVAVAPAGAPDADAARCRSDPLTRQRESFSTARPPQRRRSPRSPAHGHQLRRGHHRLARGKRALAAERESWSARTRSGRAPSWLA